MMYEWIDILSNLINRYTFYVFMYCTTKNEFKFKNCKCINLVLKNSMEVIPFQSSGHTGIFSPVFLSIVLNYISNLLPQDSWSLKTWSTSKLNISATLWLYREALLSVSPRLYVWKSLFMCFLLSSLPIFSYHHWGI